MSQDLGGVVRLRSYSKSQGHGDFDKHANAKEFEDAEDEDAGLGDERDFKRSQVGGTLTSVQCSG